MRKIIITAAMSGVMVLGSAAPSFAWFCGNVSKDAHAPDAGQVQLKDTTPAQGGGRSFNSGATGGFFGDDFARNGLVNAACGSPDHGVTSDAFACHEVNPGEFYKSGG